MQIQSGREFLVSHATVLTRSLAHALDQCHAFAIRAEAAEKELADVKAELAALTAEKGE